MAINLNKLIYPLFVKKGRYLREEILSMPGVYRVSPDMLLDEALSLQRLGIRQVLLFGVPDKKDWQGKSSYADKNIVAESIKLLKKSFPGITVIADVCLCAYTSHGHCGVIKDKKKGIDSRLTLNALSRIALSYAARGADYVAPSAMAKGQVRAIRKALDKNGFRKTKILGYSAKFASSFYGPFRDIAKSSPRFGDRRAYQLDYTDRKTALQRIEDDIKQGADIVMVKPALGYLDIIKEARRKFKWPLAAYNVSGEYAMVKNGAKNHAWLEKDIVFEIINSINRAGADFIITYHAKDIAKWVNN
ncbi:MAG: porphobilinogen synthase [Candidatus Omnitrophica bacterium]|nr:porphobilinogen synthase [Candidatus Omnitrophota bacterium]MBU4589437.1 porphobilinogen synthase [Candidatus Omnitrophota bacterium]